MHSLEINGGCTMSQKFTRFNVTELKTIRVTCKSCGLVLESPLDKAAAVFGLNSVCPACKTTLYVGNPPVVQMAQLITQLCTTPNACIEFEIPEPTIDEPNQSKNIPKSCH